jgi:uncharacterized membrane protein YoaK (UPF0700 family)
MYGTVEPRRPTHNRLFSATDAERVGLLRNETKPPSIGHRLTTHFMANVSSQWADIVLLYCYIITGLLDSSSVYTFGSFVSMQTGNTVYLGTGIVAPKEDDRWLRALTSVVCFCLGSFFFSRYHRYFGIRKRWVIVSSFALQTVMIAVSATMVTIGPKITPKGELNKWVVIPLALIGFQAAGQAYISRALKYGGLTSVVLTSIYCDLFGDEKLFTSPRSNAERNRRAAAAVLLLIGAMGGGIWAHSSIGLAGALWTAVVLKTAVVVAWCLWASDNVGA